MTRKTNLTFRDKCQCDVISIGMDSHFYFRQFEMKSILRASLACGNLCSSISKPLVPLFFHYAFEFDDN